MALGYRVVHFDLKKLKAETAMQNIPVDLSPGSKHQYDGGIYLGTTEDFTEYYVDLSDKADIVLTFEFDENDVISGDLSPKSEVVVSKATLVNAKFHDEELDEKFGHFLRPEIVAKRKAICLKDKEPVSKKRKSMVVVRTQDARLGMFSEMDYVYALGRVPTNTSARAALLDFEAHNHPKTSFDLMIKKVLEHAVTTALYSGEDQVVSFSVVDGRDVYPAENPGEFQYAGPSVEATQMFRVKSDLSVHLERISPYKKKEASLSL